MRIDQEKLQSLASRDGLSLNQLLRDSGVSKTAYYSLVRQPSILPKSIEKLAAKLRVAPSELLEAEDEGVFSIRKLQEHLEAIMENASEASRENIWHTLLLKRENPLERLNRSLRRGRGAALFKERAKISKSTK